MLIVPTTPIPFDPDLPNPGGRTEVCLSLNSQPRIPVTEGRSSAVKGIAEAIRSHPIDRPSSKNP